MAGQRNIRLTISYLGTGYHGWQRQHEAITVQGVLEGAIEKILGEKISLLASGRTDAGVHALGQVAGFRTCSKIPIDGLKRGLNAILPDDISILHAEEAPEQWHPIGSVKSKIYRYEIITSPVKLPLFKDRAWLIKYPLNIDGMKAAAEILLGTHDFSCFRASGSSASHSVRTIFHIHIESRPIKEYPEQEITMVTITVEADGFLRYMVRNISGLLVDVGLQRRSTTEVSSILESRDRRMSSPTAPACGLYLVRVIY